MVNNIEYTYSKAIFIEMFNFITISSYFSGKALKKLTAYSKDKH